METYRHIDVRPVAGALGAEIRGVDLKAAGEAAWNEIRAAFLDRLVLFFLDQQLEPKEMAAAGAQFGQPDYYPFIEGLPEEPYVIPLIKEADERKNFGEGWHSDTTYTEKPPKATCLYSVDLPEIGGDTLFANMYLAYDALSDGMKALLAPLKAVNSAAARKDGGRAS